MRKKGMYDRNNSTALAVIVIVALLGCSHKAEETISLSELVKKDDIREVIGYKGGILKEVKRQATGAVIVNFFDEGKTSHLLNAMYEPVDEELKAEILKNLDGSDTEEILGTRVWIRREGYYREIDFFLPGDKIFAAILAADEDQADLHAPVYVGRDELVKLAELVLSRAQGLE